MAEPRTLLMKQLKSVGLRTDDVVRRLKIDRTTLFRWAKKGIPLDRLDEVQKLTGLPHAVLRPDLAAKFHPAQPSSEAAA
jgi:hypothetical protein